MYVRPWWLELLKWLLAGLLLAGLGRWLNAIRLRPRPASQQGELPYPPGTLRLAALCTAFMSGLSAGCLFWPNDSVTWWVTTGFLLFTALSVHWLLDCLVARFIPDDRGLAYRSPFGRRGRLEWSAVVEVRYVAWAHWFRLRDREGRTVRVADQRMGLPEFADLLLLQVHPGAFDATTRGVLEDTAAGDPPDAV